MKSFTIEISTWSRPFFVTVRANSYTEAYKIAQKEFSDKFGIRGKK